MTSPGSVSAEVTATQREAACAAATQALSWGIEVELPTMETATAVVDSLSLYGDRLRDAVFTAMPTVGPYLMGEAERRLRLPHTPAFPNLPQTPETVVRRAQNLARLISAFLAVLDIASFITGEPITEGETES